MYTSKVKGSIKFLIFTLNLKISKNYLPLGGGGGGATVALDPGTGKDMLCFNSGLVGEPNGKI